MDKSNPTAEAVAVSQNKIVAIGSNKEIKALADEKTKLVNAEGNLVLPGFNDSHVHFLNMGLQFFSADFGSVKNTSELLEKIKTYVYFLPKGQWIRGSGLKLGEALPTRKMLDAAGGEHPVFIYSADGQTALADSAALKKFAAGKAIEELRAKGFETDGDKNFTGILRGEAVAYAKTFLPLITYEKDKAAIAEAATKYAAFYGVTSVQDMHSDNIFETLNALEREGKLKTRVYDCFYITDRKKYGQTKFVREDTASLVRRGCLKYLIEEGQVERAKLARYILEADRDGWQIMIHAIGNRSINTILNIFEQTAAENGARDRRFRIEHAHGILPSDIPRFGSLKIIASMQPYLFFGGVFDQSEPYRSLLDAKANLAFGSDALMIEVNPLWEIYAAVLHEYSGSVSKQSLTVEEAVRAYTQGSAYAEFQENSKGTLSVGKLADMVMLSKDIFTAGVNEIRSTKILMTIVDGKIVYESAEPA